MADEDDVDYKLVEISDDKSAIEALVTIAVQTSRLEHDGKVCLGCSMAALANALAIIAHNVDQTDYTIEEVVKRVTEVIEDPRILKKGQMH